RRTPYSASHCTFQCRSDHRLLVSFPTRRSSDLIIYVVPFTTIIEQNAADVRSILQDDEHILGHHSNVIFDENINDEAQDATSKQDRKSTRLNSSHVSISYAVFCLKKKKVRVAAK